MDSHLLFISVSSRKGVVRRAWVLVAPGGEVREVVQTSRGAQVRRATLQAAVEGIGAVPEGQSVIVCAHDQVLVDLGREHLRRWQAAGWKRKRKKLRDVDLLQELASQMDQHTVYWQMVKRGHPTLARARELGRLEAPRIARVSKPEPLRSEHVVDPPPQRVLAYTDGGCRGNPGGVGGWAFLLVDTATGRALERAGGEERTTNNRMELTAAIRALEALRGESRNVVVRSDSRYLVDLCSKWLPGWKARGWRRSGNQPILNLDLVQQLDVLMARHFVHWEWVKSHSGEPGNELVDALASRSMDKVSAGEDPAWERRWEQCPLNLGRALEPS